MFTYQSGTLSGLAAYSATSRRGLLIKMSVDTSTFISGFLGRLRHSFVDISFRRPDPVCGKARGQHEALNRVDGGARHDGSSVPVAFSNKQRRASLRIRPLPDLGLRATVCQQLHNLREA